MHKQAFLCLRSLFGLQIGCMPGAYPVRANTFPRRLANYPFSMHCCCMAIFSQARFAAEGTILSSVARRAQIFACFAFSPASPLHFDSPRRIIFQLALVVHT